jgi:threonine synthase
MDIQVSSNFERALFDVYDREGAAVSQLMQDLQDKGEFVLSQGALERLQLEFDSGECSEDETRAAIATVLKMTGEVVCPHTAVGIKVAADLRINGRVPMITLATAHAAKFPDAVAAACGQRPALPPHLADLFDRPERVTHVAHDLAAIKNIILKGIPA